VLETFGTRLRRQRERRQVSVAAIAEQTKIKAALLDALERDDVSQWPVGIFRRAYLRCYAKAVGLDPEALVREFLELYPDPADAAPEEPATRAGGLNEASGPPTRFRYLVGSAMRSLSGSREVAADASRARVATAIAPVPPPVPADPDLLATAQLCTALSRADDTTDLQPLLREAARIIDASGLIVWAWDPRREVLRPVFSHGYPQALLAQLPNVRRDANNPTAQAFRSEQLCVVHGTDQSSGALAVPLMGPAGCTGILAIEVGRGVEQKAPVLALVTILAAQIARSIGLLPERCPSESQAASARL
jgi:transcriptional regulator with XRE-family HTH domain